MPGLGAIFTVLGNAPKVFGIVAAVVAGVEALGAAAAAKGRDKRELAIERAQAQLAEVDLALSRHVLATVVDVTVWVANTFFGKSWSNRIKAEAEGAKRTAAESVKAANGDDGGGDDLEERARAEFRRVEQRNGGRDGTKGE